MRAYAIGDIHGHLDKLRAVHALIAADRKLTGDDAAPVVHLGDLVDRGPDSAGVIDYLMAGPARGGPWITLKGNHDHMFRLFLGEVPKADPGLRPDLTWLDPRLGGQTTLASYGIENVAQRPPEDLHTEARARVPAGHLAFVDNLPLMCRFGTALYVHAGIRPGVPFDQQKPVDLMWIRREFHQSSANHGALIVHGHTPVDVPMHYGNRLNLDTGAAYGGPLTVAVLEDDGVHELTSGGRIQLWP